MSEKKSKPPKTSASRTSEHHSIPHSIQTWEYTASPREIARDFKPSPTSPSPSLSSPLTALLASQESSPDQTSFEQEPPIALNFAPTGGQPEQTSFERELKAKRSAPLSINQNWDEEHSLDISSHLIANWPESIANENNYDPMQTVWDGEREDDANNALHLDWQTSIFDERVSSAEYDDHSLSVDPNALFLLIGDQQSAAHLQENNHPMQQTSWDKDMPQGVSGISLLQTAWDSTKPTAAEFDHNQRPDLVIKTPQPESHELYDLMDTNNESQLPMNQAETLKHHKLIPQGNEFIHQPHLEDTDITKTSLNGSSRANSPISKPSSIHPPIAMESYTNAHHAANTSHTMRIPHASHTAHKAVHNDPSGGLQSLSVSSYSASHPGMRTIYSTVLPKVMRVGDRVELRHTPEERYERKRPLGAGAMGEVTLVYDRDIGRHVAFKQLKNKELDERLLVRFIKEVQITGRLDHPNVVALHDVGIDPEGQYFFVMKYLEGETLQDIIEKLKKGDREYHERFPFAERLAIFQKILNAMQFAHTKRVIHRDLKPANIIIGKFGEVTVMDWGIAKQLDEQPAHTSEQQTKSSFVPSPKSNTEHAQEFATHANSVLGTLAYMPPEQASAQNHKLDERSDIYSLCAIFYEFLTLRHYLEEHFQDYQTLWIAVIKHPPKAPFFLVPPTNAQGRPPAELLHFVLKGLQKDPNQRYNSIKEMSELLQKIADGRIPVQCPITLMRSIGNSILRITSNSPIITMLGQMLLILVAGIGLFQSIRWIISLLN
jgi:serine/threonine-protein kinase